MSEVGQTAPAAARAIPAGQLEVIVGLADLVREVWTHGRTARFEQRAPGLLEEARLVLTAAKDGKAG
jgi:hypothetical protein